MKIASHFYCQTHREARAEVQRRKLLPESHRLIHRISRSPYHGYVVCSFDADLYVEGLMDESAAKAYTPILPRNAQLIYGRRS